MRRASYFRCPSRRQSARDSLGYCALRLLRARPPGRIELLRRHRRAEPTNPASRPQPAHPEKTQAASRPRRSDANIHQSHTAIVSRGERAARRATHQNRADHQPGDLRRPRGHATRDDAMIRRKQHDAVAAASHSFKVRWISASRTASSSSLPRLRRGFASPSRCAQTCAPSPFSRKLPRAGRYRSADRGRSTRSSSFASSSSAASTRAA